MTRDKNHTRNKIEYQLLHRKYFLININIYVLPSLIK